MGIPIISDILDEIDTNVVKYGDPRTKNWFMLFGNPIPVWILSAIYLIFVIYAGPKYMKNRQPYSLQYFMVVYNIGLVFLSIYMFVEIMLSTSAAGYDWLCAPYTRDTWKDPREQRVANVLWYYGFSKVIELLDTVLMVVRKKDRQITFLHVFHHVSMLNIWWWVPTFIPGGQTWFGACLNCFVHIVMYAYYGLAVIPALREKLWWKKYITNLQLIQFVTTFTHSCQTYVTGCDFPLWGQILLIGYMMIMLCLFGNFYFQSYINSKKTRSKIHPKKSDAVTNGHIKNGEEKSSQVKNGSYIEATNGRHTNGISHRH